MPGDQLNLRGSIIKECWRNADACHSCLDNTPISESPWHAVQRAGMAQYVQERPPQLYLLHLTWLLTFWALMPAGVLKVDGPA